jgi:hypothetical protein
MVNRENVIEWLTGQTHITVTFSEKKYINKVKKLAEKFPNEVKITAVNKDGSIVAHLPKSALKLNVIKKKDLTEDERQELRERLHG